VSLDKIASVLNDGNSFLLTTHTDPDADGIGSMLALGKALLDSEKDVILLTQEPVLSPFSLLKDAGMIVQEFDSKNNFDAVVVLDCAGMPRLGKHRSCLEGHKPMINIDHHETNDFFGDLNLVDSNSSSTGELVFELIKIAGLPIGYHVAENIFIAIQNDTGAFRHENTTSASLRISAEMMEYGVKPWEVSRRIMDGYSLSRLRLLEMALGTIEFHHKGKIAIMTISLDMFEKAKAHREDCEGFIDYPRFTRGVELAVLIRQTDEKDYKFSLRSNKKVNVAMLASCFGGGGHARAAGFECHGSIQTLRKKFLAEVVRFL
jgi:phosphoesterase RecJ-like protein